MPPRRRDPYRRAVLAPLVTPRTRPLDCGHDFAVDRGVRLPAYGDRVWCRRCNAGATVTRSNHES